MSQFKSGLKIKINDGKEFLPDVLKLSGNGLTLDQATAKFISTLTIYLLRFKML